MMPIGQGLERQKGGALDSLEAGHQFPHKKNTKPEVPFTVGVKFVAQGRENVLYRLAGRMMQVIT